jgi:hypothetical protein
MKKMMPIGSYYGRAKVFGCIMLGILLFAFAILILEFLQR